MHYEARRLHNDFEKFIRFLFHLFHCLSSIPCLCIKIKKIDQQQVLFVNCKTRKKKRKESEFKSNQDQNHPKSMKGRKSGSAVMW